MYARAAVLVFVLVLVLVLWDNGSGGTECGMGMLIV
jgi:hypothetical protein